MDLFRDIEQLREITSRTVDLLGLPYADPFNEEAIISSVDDPKEEGRVKVIFTKDDVESDWMYVNGSGSGRLSAQYIGARCTIIKIRGDSSAGIVSAIYSGSSGQATVSNPVQIPLVTEQLASRESDPGMKCNKGNEGRAYIVSNEFGQDLVICIKRNSIQRDGGKTGSWSWKSLTNAEWIEKGLDPGAVNDPTVTKAFARNPGIPQCTEALAGEEHDFSEDRAFRSYRIRCRRDENGKWNWAPTDITPTFFRTTLPNCTEALHGMNALLDSGRESVKVTCQRYANQMLWIKEGKREPLQFFNEDPPPSKKQWISGITPIPILNPSLNVTDIAKGYESAVLTTAVSAISPTGTDPFLRQLLNAANALPGTFDSAQTWSDIAKILILNKSTLPVDSIITQLSQSFEEGGDLSSGTSDILQGLGGIADILVTGVKTNNTSDALQTIGKKALGEALNSLSPGVASVYYGYTIGGALGAIDTAVSVGLDILPEPIGNVLGPLAKIGQRALAKQPIGYSTIIDAAVNGGLIKSVADLVQGKGDLSAFNFDSLLGAAGGGGLGSVTQILSAYGQISNIAKIGPSNIVQTATTALGLYNLGKGFADTLGNGGLSVETAAKFLGVDPVVSLVKSVSGLFGGGAKCPCSTDRACRKTDHGKDSDGGNLLKGDNSPYCGNNFSGRAFYANDPTNPDGAGNPVTQALGIAETFLGSELVGSILDLTDLVKSNPKLDNIGDSLWNARYADGPEFYLELAHTGELLSKTVKSIDNNITKGESIDRKLIDTSYQILTTLLEPGGGVKGVGAVSELLRVARANSKAIGDLHKMVQALNNAKSGPKVPTSTTPSIGASVKSVPRLLNLSRSTRAKSSQILAQGIKRADEEWRSVSPGMVSLSDVILGDFSPDLPVPFEQEGFVFNKDRVLRESLASQLNNTQPQIDIEPRLSQDLANEIGEQTLSKIIKDVQDRNKGKGAC